MKAMNHPRAKVVIAAMGMAHGNVVSVLHEASFDDGWSPFTIRQLLNMPGTFGLIAVPDGTDASEPDLAGFVLVRIAAGDCEILSLAVNEAWRSAGVGYALMDAAIARAQAAGVDSVFLEVAEDNTVAQALYRKLGFSAVGRRKDYYKRRAGPPMAALTFSRILTR